MNIPDRLALASKLRALNALSDQLSEALIAAEGPLALLAGVDALHTSAAELLAQVVGMMRQPGEMPFVGANVAIDETAADKDRESQRVMADAHHERADQRAKGAA